MNRMKRCVIQLVREVVNKYASTTTPTFDEICFGLGLNVVEDVLPDRKEGMYVEKEKTIFIDSRMQNEERKRFTQFHEVVHYLIREDEDLISELQDYPYSTDSMEDEYERVVEILCNIGAAEFLMPRDEFKKLYTAEGFNVELILRASHRFKSSTIATTIQLAQIAPNKCITAILEYGLTPKNIIQSQDSLFNTEYSHQKPKWHVIYSASSPAADRWLAKYTVFPDDHLINQAFLQSKMLEAESYIPFPNWRDSCFCEVLPYKNRVYALFHLSPLPDPNQMKLF